MLPHMTSPLTEGVAGNVKNRVGAPSQTCPVENSGLSYLLGVGQNHGVNFSRVLESKTILSS